MIVGYARVSTKDQKLEMQIDALKKAGAEKIYEEKMSGRIRERPQLEELLGYVRQGDKVVVYKLDRISRSMKHMVELAELFRERGVDFISINDNIDTSTPVGRFFFNVMASIAELEREITVERTKSGLAAARARGRKGGRPRKDESLMDLALHYYQTKKYTLKEIKEKTGVSSATIYRRLSEQEKATL